MKKREIDLFGILLGIVIGCILGYLVFTNINIEEDDSPTIKEQESMYGTVYTIQLGTSDKLENLNQTIERLKVLNIYYEVYQESNRFYIFNSIFDSLEKAQNKKTILESYDFNVSIRSDYILDLPKNVITSTEKYEFYVDVVNCLLTSLKGEQIIISEKYYVNPVDIELFSALSILQSIKNDEIKANYQLNTFTLLMKKIK